MDPPLDDQNGQIVHYVVRYFPASDSSSVREEEVEAAEGQDDVIEHVVNQLQPFTTYEFVVAAATDVGLGPFSNPSSVRMPQDGELTGGKRKLQNDYIIQIACIALSPQYT